MPLGTRAELAGQARGQAASYSSFGAAFERGEGMRMRGSQRREQPGYQQGQGTARDKLPSLVEKEKKKKMTQYQIFIIQFLFHFKIYS